MIIGYEMFRNLTQGKHVKKAAHREKFAEYLLKPGTYIYLHLLTSVQYLPLLTSLYLPLLTSIYLPLYTYLCVLTSVYLPLCTYLCVLTSVYLSLCTHLTHTDIYSIFVYLYVAGPDLVVCDEGHLLKNSKSNIRKSVMRIESKRRVVLTGTPLQNNLKECRLFYSLWLYE